MNDFLYYLIKISIAFSILYILYKFCFSKMTFHSLNRVILLFTLPLSLVIPFINIELITTTPIHVTDVSKLFNDFEPISNNIIATQNIKNSFNIIGFMLLIYGVGLAFGLLKFSFNLFKLTQLKQNGKTIKEYNYSIIRTDIKLPFSFFRWIYIPLNFQEKNNDSIIKHEKLHGELWHTLDLIFTELYRIVFWFNPFVYMFHKDLKTVHEYQVDAILIKGGVKKSDYLQLMLNNIIAPYKFIGLYNYFNGLTIKKRVNMITKNKNSRWQLLRYFLIIPVIAIMTMSFTSEITNNTNDIPSIVPLKLNTKHEISSGFGKRFHPILKKEKFHNGVDFKAKKGTPVIASANGIITTAEFNKKGYGNLIIINHGGGYETMYGQLESYIVKNGTKVNKGDVIGYVGESGRATAPHLHYEVLKNGKNVNPANYFN